MPQAAPAASFHMSPPAIPYLGSHLQVPPGYTSNHLVYPQHRAKILNQVSEYSRHVTVCFALHSLKPEGK
ncbi:hypothetical protein PHLCEN_2v358 [Hermanssonia centrifuga]|uniref:Uncharacterized protein n=1 Tax=Hermanssonia centrifuga TaxID=98765 RepID=A0A2R6S667_9APHY|nr:hypothetical protein PHLCEN_2v358 [Hermanssonia centrifuga]